MAAAATHRALYEQWVRLYSAELYRYAYRLTGRHAAAEDLTQESFAEAWRSIESLRDPASARGWLFQILRHRYAHFVERTRRQPAEALPEEEALHPPAKDSDPAIGVANRDAIQVALDGLPPDLVKTFLMVFAEQLTCKETAEQLGIPLGTVLSRIDRARRILRAPPSSTKPKTTNGTPVISRRVEAEIRTARSDS